MVLNILNRFLNSSNRSLALLVKGWIIPLLLLFASAPVRAGRLLFDVLPGPEAIIDTTFYSQYPFIRFINPEEDASLIRLTDDEFLDQAGRIIFKVNRFDVITNDSLLHILENEVIPRINSDSLRLRRMILRGAASPEGPFLNNKMLGTRRGQRLADFLRQRLAVPVVDSTFSSEVVIEDYRLLCAMMRRAADPDYNTVQQLCDRYLPGEQFAQLKRSLQTLQQGRLWRRLLRTYFPELRAARIVLVFENEPVGKPEEPEEETVIVSRRNKGGTTTGQGQVAVHETPTDTIPATVTDTIPEPPVPQLLRRRELLAVKSNLLFDFAYVPGYDRWCPIPNIAIEYFPLRGHFTFGASLDHPWWQHYWDHKYFQVRNYQVETRYYLRSGSIDRNPEGEGAAFRGWYLQAYAHATRFGICFSENRGWVGEGAGAGLGFGYVIQLSKRGHWRLELGAQVGYFRCQYDPYVFENLINPAYRDNLYYYKWTGKPADFHKRQYRWNWIGPTRVGITLSYDLLYRPRKRDRGISFKSTEWYTPEQQDTQDP